VPVTVYAMNLAERGRAQELAAKCPDLDILVNNAGSTPRARCSRSTRTASAPPST